MNQRTDNPWLAEEIDAAALERVAAAHVANSRAVESGVGIVSDPHHEDDQGFNWDRLSDARRVQDVAPSAAVVVGTPIGVYLAKVVAWDFEVDDDDPIVTLDLLPIRPSEVSKLLGRNRTSAA